MHHRPALDFGTLLIVLVVLAATLLASCTTARPAPANSVGRHEHRHDRRTKQREPYALSYTTGTNLTTPSR